MAERGELSSVPGKREKASKNEVVYAFHSRARVFSYAISSRARRFQELCDSEVAIIPFSLLIPLYATCHART